MDERTKKSIEDAREKYAKEYIKHYSDGKPYLPFKAKLAMFREVFPFGSISVSCSRDFDPSTSGIIASATIYANVEAPGNLPLVTAFAQRTPGNLKEDEAGDTDFNIYEIAESAAISKALTLIGIDLPNSYLSELLKDNTLGPVNSEVVSEFVPEEVVDAGQVEDIYSNLSETSPSDNEEKPKRKTKKKSQSPEKTSLPENAKDSPSISESPLDTDMNHSGDIAAEEPIPDNAIMNMTYEWRNRKGLLKDLVNGNEADHIFLKWLAKEGTPFSNTYPEVHNAAKELIKFI